MNPILDWRDARNQEIMAGGKARYCIMGSDDFAKFCGAIGAFRHTIEAIGMNGDLYFEGVRVFESRSAKTGILFTRI